MSPKQELKTTKRLFERLISSEKIRFPHPYGRLEAPETQGVYIISDPKGTVVHVGRTPRARRGLRQRLKDHLHGRSSFTKKHLKGKSTRLRSGYRYQCVEVADPRRRALLESYTVGVLCPKHLGTG